MKSLGEYSGDAGDAFSIHLNRQFYTHDKDNAANCSQNSELKVNKNQKLIDNFLGGAGGWWFIESCGHSNLNGLYQIDGKKDKNSGIVWDKLYGPDFSAKEARMVIRPKTFHNKDN